MARPSRRVRKSASLTPAQHIDHAETFLTLAARHIDTAGYLAGTEQADMLACFASNVLQGSRSLLRELRAALRKQEKERG